MNRLDLVPAPLSDPLYYLHNARLWLRWCLAHHADLLEPGEIATLEQILSLDTPAQALLIRMAMRKGELFRVDALVYAEVPDLPGALHRLEEAELLDSDPLLELDTLGQLCRRQECLALARQLLPDTPLPTSATKSRLLEQLVASPEGASSRALSHWWTNAPFALVRLRIMPLLDRLRLMFFGNLRQDLSEFVLTELGVQQYEPVELTPASRAFQSRAEVDQYLELHRLQQQLAEGVALETLVAQLPAAQSSGWLEQRRQRLLFKCGREAERQQIRELALALYRRSGDREAQVRELRLLEPHEDPAQLFALAQERLTRIPQPEIRVSLRRICQRSARKAGLPYSLPPRPCIPTEQLILPQPPAARVEQAVVEHLGTRGGWAAHVENRLFTGLFALLFWPALFAPVRGAFFNPFQSGPADLFRPEFATTRQAEIDAGFTSLDNGDYQSIILARLGRKRGISCALVHWPALKETLVEQVLALVPPAHLRAIFQHLLLDLRHHRRGLPDLIHLDPTAGAYQLIEVKGPGDRLQDHQRLWLEFMVEQQMPVSVWHVAWANG